MQLSENARLVLEARYLRRDPLTATSPISFLPA